jgi:hypothetical protein
MPNYKKTLLSLFNQLNLSLNVDELVDNEVFQKKIAEFVRLNVKNNLDDAIIIPEEKNKDEKNELELESFNYLNLIFNSLKQKQNNDINSYKDVKNIMKDLYEIDKKNKKKDKKKSKKHKKKNEVEEENESNQNQNQNQNQNNSIIIHVYNILWKQLLLDLGEKYKIAYDKINVIMTEEGDNTSTIYNYVKKMDILKFKNNNLSLPNETIEDMIFVLTGKKTFLGDSGTDTSFSFDETITTKEFIDSVLSQPILYSVWNTIQMISYFFVYIPPDNLANLEILVRQLQQRHGSRRGQKIDFRSIFSNLVQTLTMI